MKHLKLYEEYSNSIYPEFYTDKTQILEWIGKGLHEPIDYYNHSDIVVWDDGSVDLNLHLTAEDWAKDFALSDIQYSDDELDEILDSEDFLWALDNAREQIYYEDISWFTISEDMLVNGFIPVQIRHLNGNLLIEENILYSLRGFPKTIGDMRGGLTIEIGSNPITSLQNYPTNNPSDLITSTNLISENPNPGSIRLDGYLEDDAIMDIYNWVDAGMNLVTIMKVMEIENPTLHQRLMSDNSFSKWVDKITKADKYKGIIKF